MSTAVAIPKENQPLPVSSVEHATIRSVAINQLVVRRIVRPGWTWTLYAAHSGGEPTIKDLDWAERLGFERPRNIRNLIKRMADAGKLGTVVCSAVKQTSGSAGGRTAVEYYLTKSQALKVAAKSETQLADALLDEMIAVFLAYEQGVTPPPAPAPCLPGGDDEDERMLAMMESAVHLQRQGIQMKRELQQVAAVQYTQALEISSLKQVRTDVLAESVASAPAGLFAVGYDAERLYIRKTVDAWTHFRGCDTETAWRYAYSLLLDIGRFDARKRCDNQTGPASKRLNKLGIVAQEHKMVLFASIVKQHMGDVMQRAQTALIERAQAAGGHFHA